MKKMFDGIVVIRLKSSHQEQERSGRCEMSRYFAIQSWVSSHDNEPDYSGQQCGERNVRSVEIPMFTQHGKANVDWFSDEAIAARTARKTQTISIKDKILPQFKRLNVLHSQMIELEQSYKAGEMDISEYSLLRDCLVAKKERAEVLYRKAISVKPKSYEDDVDLCSELPQDEAVYGVNLRGMSAVESSTWVDDLSASNSLKLPLQKTLHVVRTLVRLSHKARAYYQTLKEV